MSEYQALEYDKIIHQTKKAVLVAFGEDEEWIPLSLIKDLEDNHDYLLVKPFFLEDKEHLEEYIIGDE